MNYGISSYGMAVQESRRERKSQDAVCATHEGTLVDEKLRGSAFLAEKLGHALPRLAPSSRERLFTERIVALRDIQNC